MGSVLFNNIIKRYLLKRYKRVENIRKAPHVNQENIFKYITCQAKNTNYGMKYRFASIKTKDDFRNGLPIVEYADIKPLVEKMMMGEPDILWPGKVNWFAKSSGTTNEKSKFIPVSQEKFYQSHVTSSWDLLSTIYYQRPKSKLFSEKNLVMGGSLERYAANPETRYGDVSAIMIQKMPAVGRPFYTPDFKTAMLPDWEEKLEIMSEICPGENVVMIGGVPTWIIVLFRKILEKSGKSNILEVWPNLKTYIHGGVGFEPYKEHFKELIPSDDFDYVEVYNASEGYFGIQDRIDRSDLLLLLDNGIYFEFLPMEEWESENPVALELRDVELNKNYALVISTCAGLWRYVPGDTVRFTSKDPYRIKVTGRTKHFINAFGEELMIANTDKAIARACDDLNAVVTEYTVAPIYFEEQSKAGHQWVVEFEKTPVDLSEFALKLDKQIQEINSDYEAKRYKDLALGPLKIVCVPEGSFVNWMKQRGKAGGQHKIPRLSNSREYVEDILNFVSEQNAYAQR